MVGPLIEGLGIPVMEVADLTGFPECLEGRVKTLHPKSTPGSSPTPASPTTCRSWPTWGSTPFELVVVNLYPFRETVASGATPDECVEQIDIGGPTMVRAAAKNHPSVAIVTDPSSYADVLAPSRAVASRSTERSGSPPRRSRTPRPTTSPSPLVRQRLRRHQ